MNESSLHHMLKRNHIKTYCKTQRRLTMDKTLEDLMLKQIKEDYPQRVFENEDALLIASCATAARTHSKGDWVSVEDALPELTEHLYWINDETGEREPYALNYEATVLGYNEETGVFKAKY